jgi:hypothetical protein
MTKRETTTAPQSKVVHGPASTAPRQPIHPAAARAAAWTSDSNVGRD